MTQIVAGYLDRTPILKVVGGLDRGNGSEIVGWGEERLGGGSRLLLLDLSECSYADSGGLGSLFTLLQILGPRGALGVFGTNPNLNRMMELVGLLSTPAFRLFSDEAAVRAFLREEELQFGA